MYDSENILQLEQEIAKLIEICDAVRARRDELERRLQNIIEYVSQENNDIFDYYRQDILKYAEGAQKQSDAGLNPY